MLYIKRNLFLSTFNIPKLTSVIKQLGECSFFFVFFVKILDKKIFYENIMYNLFRIDFIYLKFIKFMFISIKMIL